MSYRTPAAICVAVAMTALAACADDSGDEPAKPTTAAAKATPAPKVAQELIGTWKARVPLSEIPDLEGGPASLGPNWEIQILEGGATKPTLVYVNKSGGIRGGYRYKVAGDRITVTDSNCSSGPARTVFSFAVQKDTLTFKTIRNPCADQVTEDLLTARPWRRG
jgi:hypothetical protein